MKRILLMLLVIGCAPATRFHGSPTVDGPAACRATCSSWGMDLAGMVQMGAYSNGCICRERAGAAAPAAGAPVSVGPDDDVLAAGAAIAAATAVMVATEEDEAHQRQNPPPVAPRR